MYAELCFIYQRSYVIMILCLFTCLLLTQTAPAQVTAITVNSTDDPGVSGDNFITLREAILFATGKATASGGETAFAPGDYGAFTADTILFDPVTFPPTDSKTIFVSSPGLPALDSGDDAIDASNAGVIIDLSKITEDDPPFTIRSDRNRLHGLQFHNSPTGAVLVLGNENLIGGDRAVGNGPVGQGNQFSYCKDCGIRLAGWEGGGSNNTVMGNLLGTDATGKSAAGNNMGIMINTSAMNNTVGGTTSTTRNIISGNQMGIVLQDDCLNNKIIGNYIGTDISGDVIIPNVIGIDASSGNRNITLGDSDRNSGNLIAGSLENGMRIWGETENIKILGNTFLNNGGWAINLFGLDFGGADTVLIEENIFGKNRDVIYLGSNVNNVVIRNNYIGIMPDGTRIGNTGSGIDNFDAVNVTIGPGNHYWYNTGNGIHIVRGSTRITQNSISKNTGSGISIDQGGNNDIQSPDILLVDSTQVTGTCPVQDGSVVEIFNDPQDEGETYIGSTTVSNGQFVYTGVIPTTGNVTATVTDPEGNTSAFSVPRKNPYAYATPTPTRTPRPTSTPRPTATVTPTPTPTLPQTSNTVLSIGSVTGKPNDTVTVPIQIQQAPATSAYQFDLEYDPTILSYEAISKEGTLSKDFLLVDGNEIEKGTVRIAGAAFTAQPFSGNGTVLSVVFKIDASATDGETILKLDNLKDDFLGAKVEPGKVIVSTFVAGDVNGDGSVTAGDAQLAFEFAIGKKQPSDEQRKAGDVDGNGEITAGDAQKIFYLSIGRNAKRLSRSSSPIKPLSAQRIGPGSLSGTPGTEIWLPVNVQAAANVSAFTFDLLFDSAMLEFISVRKESSLSAPFLLVEGNEISSGRVRIGGVAFTASPIDGDGTLVFAGFQIKASASGSIPITIENVRDDIAGASIDAGQIIAGSSNTPTPTVTPTPTIPNIPVTDPTMCGLWEFNDPNDPAAATLGKDLKSYGQKTVIDGLFSGDKAVTVDTGSYYRVDHELSSNGGGKNVNQYSLLIDFRVQAFAPWTCFLNTDYLNRDDGESWLSASPEGRVNVGDPIGSSVTGIVENQWYRLVIVFDLPNNDIFYYIDGLLLHHSHSEESLLDSRYSLLSSNNSRTPIFLLFADENGEDGPIDVTNAALFNYPLSSSEILELNDPYHSITGSHAIIPTPTPPAAIQPMKVFTLDSVSEFTEIPGGFSNPPAPGGTVEIANFSGGGNAYSDGKGALITAEAGQVELLLFPTLDIGDSMILVRASVKSSGPGAAIALVTLDGSMDGSIATNIPADSILFQDQFRRMTMVYDPPGSSMALILQVANLAGQSPVQVYLDNLEVYLLPKEGSIPVSLLYGW